MAFWSTPMDSRDPKRAFRFTVEITGLGGDSVVWFAKTVQRPNFTVETAEHKYLNHTFYFPGHVTWSEVTATIVDPTEPDAAAALHGLMETAGYGPPQNANDLTTIGKSKAVGALGSVIIKMYDSGVSSGKGEPGSGDPAVVEKWELKNAWVSGLTPSELSYDSEDLSTIEIRFRYDYAELTGVDGNLIFEGP